jgi:small subunit ribosomal protein S1
MGGIPEHPELWAFLASLTPGAALSGTVAAIEPFGVFVALDEGPAHPLFPGVGFITYPELAWQRFDEASDVVQVGQRVTCEFLQFDTWNLEARLSLRAMQPDPFQEFADRVEVGQELRGGGDQAGAVRCIRPGRRGSRGTGPPARPRNAPSGSGVGRRAGR